MNGKSDKNYLKILLFILVLIASILFVRYSTKDVDNSTERMALEGLKELFSNADPDFLSDNSIALLLPNGQEISISTSSLDEIHKDGKWISPIDINVIIDGYRQPEFDYGSIGIDEIKEEARKTAVDEWVEAFGKSLVYATIGWEWGIDQNGFTVYPGSIGFRGSYPGGWLDGSLEMHQKILSGIIPLLKNHSTFIYNGYRTQTLDLKMNFNEQGESDGECRLNREISLDLLQALEGLDWPTSDSSYLVKQYYIIVYD